MLLGALVESYGLRTDCSVIYTQHKAYPVRYGLRFTMAPSRDVVDIAGHGAAESASHMREAHANGAAANGETNGAAVEGRPHNWIPIAEHVLWKATRKIRIISIGCGFSGTMSTCYWG